MGSVALLVAACGGKVVVDADGSGGQGGDTTTTTTTSVSPVGVVSASSGGSSLCQQVCDAITASGCVQDPGCVSNCEDTYANAGGCVGLLDAYSKCILENVSSGCEGPLLCQDIAQSFMDCVGVPPTTCGDLGCTSSGGECSCKGICNDRVLAVTCTPGNATDFCTCFEDGVPVGKCAEPQQTGLSCDIVSGCCSTVFFP